MIESKEVPASIYTFISTTHDVKVDVPMINHVVKAFSLESALNSLIVIAPERNYVSTGYTTLDKFVEGCKIPLQTITVDKVVDNTVDKEEIYKEILTDFMKAGDIMFTKKNEKDVWERVCNILTNKEEGSAESLEE